MVNDHFASVMATPDAATLDFNWDVLNLPYLTSTIWMTVSLRKKCSVLSYKRLQIRPQALTALREAFSSIVGVSSKAT